jgi:hypothetical protein
VLEGLLSHLRVESNDFNSQGPFVVGSEYVRNLSVAPEHIKSLSVWLPILAKRARVNCVNRVGTLNSFESAIVIDLRAVILHVMFISTRNKAKHFKFHDLRISA